MDRRVDPSYYQKITSLGFNYRLSDNVGLRLEHHWNHGYALPVASEEVMADMGVVRWRMLAGTAYFAEFYTRILGKSVTTMKVLWAQNIFSGRALPPKVADPDAEVKRLIAGNRNAIGYIRAVSVDDTVRVIEIR